MSRPNRQHDAIDRIVAMLPSFDETYLSALAFQMQQRLSQSHRPMKRHDFKAPSGALKLTRR